MSEILGRFTEPGDTVCDPFCGSGTMMIEAAVAGRLPYGSDVDPLAVFVSRAKTRVQTTSTLLAETQRLRRAIADIEPEGRDYEKLAFTDVPSVDFDHILSDSADLWVPDIPNLSHWFRRYVTLDLATINRAIHQLDTTDACGDLFLLAFASIIRNVSNADPVPVSGLEVTKHMRERESRGRVVNVFEQFDAALSRCVEAAITFAKQVDPKWASTVTWMDATELRYPTGSIDAVITSPPYHNAVDYYRRHQLEMFWLGLVESQQDRLALLPRYIGRHRIPNSHPVLKDPWVPGLIANKWEVAMREKSVRRANDFRHYVQTMTKFFAGAARALREAGTLVMVVGRSAWNGDKIPTDELMAELAAPWFELEQVLWYPVTNRYMSYSRHNHADISEDHVIILRSRQRGGSVGSQF